VKNVRSTKRKHPRKGTFAAETAGLNNFKEFQPYYLDQTVQTAAGDSLKVGEASAVLDGEIDLEFP